MAEHLKACYRCSTEKPLSAFHRDKTRRDGRFTYCKVCVLAAAKAKKQKPTERRRIWEAEYRARNRARVAANKLRWYEAHKDLAKARSRSWYAENKTKAAVRRQAYYEQNKVAYRSYRHARKARVRGAEGSYTRDELIQLLQKQQWRCVVCAVSLEGGYHVDHIVPLAAGGSNWASNIQALCAPCNLSKGTAAMADFMLRREAALQS